MNKLSHIVKNILNERFNDGDKVKVINHASEFNGREGIIIKYDSHKDVYDVKLIHDKDAYFEEKELKLIKRK